MTHGTLIEYRYKIYAAQNIVGFNVSDPVLNMNPGVTNLTSIYSQIMTDTFLFLRRAGLECMHIRDVAKFVETKEIFYINHKDDFK